MNHNFLNFIFLDFFIFNFLVIRFTHFFVIGFAHFLSFFNLWHRVRGFIFQGFLPCTQNSYRDVVTKLISKILNLFLIKAKQNNMKYIQFSMFTILKISYSNNLHTLATMAYNFI